MEKPTRKLLSISDVARITGLSAWTIRNAVADGTIPAVKLGGRGKWLIPVAAIEGIVTSAQDAENKQDSA